MDHIYDYQIPIFFQSHKLLQLSASVASSLTLLFFRFCSLPCVCPLVPVVRTYLEIREKDPWKNKDLEKKDDSRNHCLWVCFLYPDSQSTEFSFPELLKVWRIATTATDSCFPLAKILKPTTENTFCDLACLKRRDAVKNFYATFMRTIFTKSQEVSFYPKHAGAKFWYFVKLGWSSSELMGRIVLAICKSSSE